MLALAGSSFCSRSIKEPTQPELHSGPLRRHDGIARRVTCGVVGGQAMGAQYPFKLSADAFERGA